MGHLNCASWDYEDHPDAALVGNRCAKIVDFIRLRPTMFNRYAYSTLRGHRYMFQGMTPQSCSYIAGNYRGSNFPCLRDYRVQVASDGRVGVPPFLVSVYMKMFETEIAQAVSEFDVRFASGVMAPALAIQQYVSILAKFLVKFLTIHPYANGNGHSARLLVWVLLGRFGLLPKSWPLDQSPSYASHITAHRDGNYAPMEQFILKCILT